MPEHYNPPLLNILFEDDALVAVDKPAGMLVHKSAIDRYETEFLLQRLRDQTESFLYPVHRLDKPTSGVIIFAKRPEFAAALQAQMESNEASKDYLLVCRGFAPEQGVIDHPLKPVADFKRQRHSEEFKTKPAQEAATEFKCLAQKTLDVAIDRYPQSRFSLVQARLLSGRKHQLRRHFKHLSHPIIGCPRYGKSNYNRYFADELGISRLLLHAWRLVFMHPLTQQKITLCAAPNEQFLHLLRTFDWLPALAIGDTG